MIYLSIVLLVMSGAAKAFMDLSADGKLEASKNKANSWRNKWKHGDPNLGEKFPGSSTVFVFVTDFWHLMQFVFLNCLIIGTVLFGQYSNLVWSLVVCSILPRIVFEITYRAKEK